jgi:hypothetical protein
MCHCRMGQMRRCDKGIIMRKSVCKVLGLAVAGVGFVFSAMASAQAESNVIGLSCDSYATMAADIATKNIMHRATALDTNQPGKVLMIAAGRKFYIPPRQLDQDTLSPISAYDRMSAWQQAFADAKHQCRHADDFNIEVNK